LTVSLLAASPVAAGQAPPADIIEDVESVVAVRVPGTTPDFPKGSIMRTDCAFVVWIEAEDGTGTEYLACEVSDAPVMVPENQGTPPESTVNYSGGDCEWTSDYWFAKDESIVMAASYEVTVTPSGHVFAVASYPAEPLDCPEQEPAPDPSASPS
jgi:hypothetical protein